MNRKQREQNRKTHRELMTKLINDKPQVYLSVCTNCGEYGSHFVPPCFGQQGFYMCRNLWIAKEIT